MDSIVETTVTATMSDSDSDGDPDNLDDNWDDDNLGFSVPDRHWQDSLWVVLTVWA